ncbi:hypothetical protein DNK06_00035 [Pseudomonas daroniae]|uniref:OmpR/PhoB-type domain-containing protein n=1 Tax=Phytopseudomonas daroniae TaxID=2487519 RepID=A0A4Q9QRM6_9GAMM|nr:MULTISPECIES: winged helix-turn-helix domain-containing protein [Pseudomonas]TBU83163.1 hypothetical protein DNK31_10920 [Pseudomonas sp. FRB 228]TBU83823.1 hypothetical protein DNK06_00035 [Pseudomonas daroniae]TBU93000.1 hypothetical protein DNJ99_05945 [Pseudomonas daroniae]
MYSTTLGATTPTDTPYDHAPFSSEGALRFGAFTLYPRQHLLLKNGEPISLGSRALDLLIAMASRSGELLEKSELIACAWPKVIVEECNLRAQIVALRRVLGEDENGFEYIVTVPGRGYRFVARTEPYEACNEPSVERLQSLPSLITRPLGRDAVILRLSEQLQQTRLISLVGPGGIGKSTVALALGNQLASEMPHGTCFVDLSETEDDNRIPHALAEALGLRPGSDPLRDVVQHLQQRRQLLILDNCEQALDGTALVVETLLKWTPDCTILTTSREPLRTAGEQVERLLPLQLPAASEHPSGEQALAYPAIELFVERVQASDTAFSLDDGNVADVISICRKLDGIPLDIEIAATRVSAFGLAPLAELLDGDFRLQMEGRRTAPSRHRSLRATLDWSYQTLPPAEQAMLRLVAIFNGTFTLNAVRAIVEGDEQLAGDPLPLIESLVDKSLLIAHRDDTLKFYQMPKTERLYALEKLEQTGTTQRIVARHAAYALAVVKKAASQLDAVVPEAWKNLYGAESDTIRSALTWACSTEGNQSLGLELTLAALGLGPYRDRSSRPRVEQPTQPETLRYQVR